MGKYIKKEEQPWIANGRWHEFFIECDGSTYTLTNATLDCCTISGQLLMLPEGYHIIDFKYDINSDASTATSATFNLRFDGTKQGITLPAKAVFDYGTIWVFCHKGGE